MAIGNAELVKGCFTEHLPANEFIAYFLLTVHSIFTQFKSRLSDVFLDVWNYQYMYSIVSSDQKRFQTCTYTPLFPFIISTSSARASHERS